MRILPYNIRLIKTKFGNHEGYKNYPKTGVRSTSAPLFSGIYSSFCDLVKFYG